MAKTKKVKSKSTKKQTDAISKKTKVATKRMAKEKHSVKLKTNLLQSFQGKARTHKRVIKAVLFFGLLSISLTWLFWDVPLPSKLSNNQIPVSTKIFDRKGELIYEIYADKRSTPVEISDLPEYISNATIAIEDKDFYKHYGFSFTGATRAIYNTIFKKKLQGGSTLTQQLVKNALLTPERTIKRKIREFALTLIVETMYSKDQILSMYLNQIPYGGTAYGIGAASELYFDKAPKDLNLAEAALLAGLPQAPSLYSPFGSKPEAAKGRQEAVLRRMVEDKYISQEEADAAANEELKYAQPQSFEAPHFALWVKSILAEKYGEPTVEKGGLRVTTTLDLSLQKFAEDAVATEVAKLQKQKVGNGAALVVYPPTGEILAMVGSKDYFAKDEDGKVNIIFSERQPGSSIKPLNYALAIKDGKITPSTPLADIPTCFNTIGQPSYCPVNYDGTFHGAVQARFALGNSYNIPAVRVLALNGLTNFIDFAKTMGITTFKDPSQYGLSLTLGGGEVRPFDMAQAYGVFANQGIKQDLIAITKVEDWKGKTYEEVDLNDIKLTGERVLEPEVTFLISHMLYDNNARVDAFGSSSYLVVRGHPEVSVKTGTTNDRRDNWTIGYTTNALALTWVGNNDNTPMSGAVSGVSGASPIWNKVIKETLDKAEKGYYDKSVKDHAWPDQPQGVVGSTVCSNTGNIPDDPNTPNCPTRFEYFLKEYVGAKLETGSKDLQIDKSNGGLASDATPPELIETQNHPFLIDPLGTLICLDCTIPASPTTLSYP